VLAFVNSRGNYGDSALHLAVLHSNTQAIQWLLEIHHPAKEAKSRGRPALTLMNKELLTPLTLSVRQARDTLERQIF
jgi:ankyrin repeat protein